GAPPWCAISWAGSPRRRSRRRRPWSRRGRRGSDPGRVRPLIALLVARVGRMLHVAARAVGRRGRAAGRGGRTQAPLARLRAAELRRGGDQVVRPALDGPGAAGEGIHLPGGGGGKGRDAADVALERALGDR